MAPAGNHAKKLAVLEVINNKKEILFSPVENKKQKEEAWKEVLAKAQSVSLAGESRKWMHAKVLFDTWIKRTLEKVQKVNVDDTPEKKSPKIDEVDRLILGINNFINEQSSSPKPTTPRVTFVDTEISPNNQIIRKPRRTNVEVESHPKRNTAVSTIFFDAKNNCFQSPRKSIIPLQSCLKNSEKKSPKKAADATISRVAHYAIGPHETSATKKRRACSSPDHFKNKRVALRVSVTSDEMDVDEIDKPTEAIQYGSRDSVQHSNTNFDLCEIDTYLRRLKILKLERELNLPNMPYTVDTRSDEVELYYRRLQVSKLEHELKFSPSKYSMGNIRPPNL